MGVVQQIRSVVKLLWWDLFINSLKHHSQGFSLVEIFVALSIGLVLFAGVLSVFVGMRTTTSETSAYGELEENGRFAISVLSDDLSRQDFWGDLPGTLDFAKLDVIPAAPGNDCQGNGTNNASFPSATGHFRTLWGDTVTTASLMGCISDAKVGSAITNNFSDVIQLKRLVASPFTRNIVGPPPTVGLALVVPAGNYYLVANSNYGQIFIGPNVPQSVNNSRAWQYQHHVYYVREETQGNNQVPVLMQGQLTNIMSFAPIIDGIEVIRFLYGVDTDNDGIVNAYISADNMTNAFWNHANNSNIIAVKIYVLARNVMPDNKYTNTNTYQLGDLAIAVNDNYRRLLFSSTVTLFNARVDTWTPP